MDHSQSNEFLTAEPKIVTYKPLWKKYQQVILFGVFLLFLAALLLILYSSDKYPRSDEKNEGNIIRIETESPSFLDPDNPPQFIQSDFVELDKVFMISKFRSGTGHDFSVLSGETCRSMKHYFSALDPSQPNYKVEYNGDASRYPLPTVEKDVKIFSPVDGTLKFYDFAQIPFNHELQITPDSNPDVVIRLMHVQSAPGVIEGHVKAGEFIGLVLANQSFDIAISIDLTGDTGDKRIGYISYFAALPDNLFVKYQARGAQTREDLITSKEFRDANPFACHGKEVFDENYAFDDPENNLVFLTGFKEVDKLLNEKYDR